LVPCPLPSPSGKLRKTCSKRAFPRPRAHMHMHGASERAATHTCLTALCPPQRAATHRARSHPHLPHRAAPPTLASRRCALHRARGGGAHPAGPCAAARAGARHCKAAKVRRTRCEIFPRHCRVRGRTALQPCAGTYTWHRARQSWCACADARRFNRARAHIPGTEHDSPGGRPRAPHAASAGLRAYN
jgi:hypothetical protein